MLAKDAVSRLVGRLMRASVVVLKVWLFPRRRINSPGFLRWPDCGRPCPSLRQRFLNIGAAAVFLEFPKLLLVVSRFGRSFTSDCVDRIYIDPPHAGGSSTHTTK